LQLAFGQASWYTPLRGAAFFAPINVVHTAARGGFFRADQ
jgi:hypothetical protein